jgi:PAS domain S-box-containing protein
MRDEGKTKEQLVRELAATRQRITELEAAETERKRVEQVLRESEERFREMASLLPQVVGETDLRGNFTFVNQNAFQMFGYTQKDFEEGINVLQVLIPEDHERVKEGIQKVLKGERPGRNEYTAIRKDGSTFPVLVYSNPTIRQNKPAGMISIVVDIAERKRAEEALRESEGRYQNLLEDANG